MSLASAVKALHVLIGFWFVAGLIGRGVTLARARRTTNLETMESRLQVAGVFDRVMVIPGSILVLVAGLVTMWTQHRSLFEPHNWWLGSR